MKGISDEEFEKRVESWTRRFEGIAQGMHATPNEAGHYPKIDFGPLVLEFQKIITGMREGREQERSLILVPGSPQIVADIHR